MTHWFDLISLRNEDFSFHFRSLKSVKMDIGTSSVEAFRRSSDIFSRSNLIGWLASCFACVFSISMEKAERKYRNTDST
jgi:hypothetical protein